MKFTVENQNIYVTIKNISSVSMAVSTDYDTKQERYSVEISSSNGMIFRVYSSNTIELAKNLLNEIGEELEKVEPEKTYLDGFKDGTEYALDLLD